MILRCGWDLGAVVVDTLNGEYADALSEIRAARGFSAEASPDMEQPHMPDLLQPWRYEKWTSNVQAPMGLVFCTQEAVEDESPFELLTVHCDNYVAEIYGDNAQKEMAMWLYGAPLRSIFRVGRVFDTVGAIVVPPIRQFPLIAFPNAPPEFLERFTTAISFKMVAAPA